VFYNIQQHQPRGAKSWRATTFKPTY